MIRQAIILAGGKGTRLQSRLKGRPKPLIEVGDRSLLDHQMRLLKRYGFRQVLILVNHKAEQIAEFCNAQQNWGMDVRCIDDGDPRGTAGATLAVLGQLAEETLVLYGDTMMEVDLERFHSVHAKYTTAAATLFLHPNDHPHDSDLVELDDEARIIAFHGYPHDPRQDYPNLVNAALYWIRRDSLRPWFGTEGVLDFGKHLFPAMLVAGLELRGYNSPEYIKDCGTPERLDKVTADLQSGRIARSSLRHTQPIVFLDRDGTINWEVGHLRHPSQLELLPGAAEAIRRLNHSDFRCCVVTNQPVIARGEASFADLRNIHARLDSLLGQAGAYLDRLYLCPHHPDSGFEGERSELKVSCDCRKPATGMIERAAADFNMDRTRSWLVGDRSADIETARRAGLRSILVQTGYGGKDGQYGAVAEYVVQDLAKAVEIILAQQA